MVADEGGGAGERRRREGQGEVEEAERGGVVW